METFFFNASPSRTQTQVSHITGGRLEIFNDLSFKWKIKSDGFKIMGDFMVF